MPGGFNSIRQRGEQKRRHREESRKQRDGPKGKPVPNCGVEDAKSGQDDHNSKQINRVKGGKREKPMAKTPPGDQFKGMFTVPYVRLPEMSIGGTTQIDVRRPVVEIEQ